MKQWFAVMSADWFCKNVVPRNIVIACGVTTSTSNKAAIASLGVSVHTASDLEFISVIETNDLSS